MPVASLNKVQLIGNVGRDPEVRYLPSGMAVANFTMATSMRRKDKNSGETVEETQWHRITCFDRNAEIAGEYVKKGNPLYIEGSIKYGKYTDKDGVERNTCDITATALQLLGSRDRGEGGEGRQQPAREQQQPTQQQRPASGYGRPQQAAQPAQRASTGFEDMDDDIPFMDPLKCRAFALVI